MTCQSRFCSSSVFATLISTAILINAGASVSAQASQVFTRITADEVSLQVPDDWAIDSEGLEDLRQNLNHKSDSAWGSPNARLRYLFQLQTKDQAAEGFLSISASRFDDAFGSLSTTLIRLESGALKKAWPVTVGESMHPALALDFGNAKYVNGKLFPSTAQMRIFERNGVVYEITTYVNQKYPKMDIVSNQIDAMIESWRWPPHDRPNLAPRIILK